MASVLLPELQRSLPRLMGVAASSTVIKDLEVAEACLTAEDPHCAIVEAGEQRKFRSRWLTYHLCASLRRGWYDPRASLIERDLERLVVQGIPPTELRKAFEAKLLNDGQFDDVEYEIAAMAIFAQVFDAGSCKLEEPLEGSAVNPDLTGQWGGKKARVEVMRIDDMPARYDPRAREIIEEADVPCGFFARVNFPLTSTTYSPAARRMIEALYEHRDLPRGESVTVENFEFVSGRGSLHCANARSPLSYVEFTELDERDVQGAVTTTPSITASERSTLEAEHPQPENVTVMDARTRPLSFKPTSLGERIYNAVNTKKRQCESGAINVVVLGLPTPMHSENSINDALLGSAVFRARLPGSGDEDGSPELYWTRTWIGPFTDVQSLNTGSLPVEEAARYADRLAMIRTEAEMFEKVSAVLGIRLDGVRPLAVLRPNPNASEQLPAGAVAQVEQLAQRRALCS